MGTPPPPGLANRNGIATGFLKKSFFVALLWHFTKGIRGRGVVAPAVGAGINLPGATRVVLFDPSWNPQADQQAIYRAYRWAHRGLRASSTSGSGGVAQDFRRAKTHT